MNRIRQDVLAAYAGAAFPTDVIDSILAVLINEVEAKKASVQQEYQAWKGIYHAGTYRKHGETKRQVEVRLQRLVGFALAYEQALSVIYQGMSDDR